MTLFSDDFKINNGSETGDLQCLLVHSPDAGLGKVVPGKAQDWLFEDIVHLDTIRKKEYDYYVKLLLYFLDPDKIKGKLASLDAPENKRAFFTPDSAGFHGSSKVIEVQVLLTDILGDTQTRENLVAAVCAMENCSYALQQTLVGTPPAELAKIIISGFMGNNRMIFAPIPNFIFTRDVAVAINGYLLISKPAKQARVRESLLMRYIFFNHPLFNGYKENILEIPEDMESYLETRDDNFEKTTLECGDVMVVSPRHVIIGCSERTSTRGANEAIKLLFKNKVVDKVTIIKIPHKRDFMHLDTVFTQVKRDMWVLLGSLFNVAETDLAEPISHFANEKPKESPQVIQFHRDNIANPKHYSSLEKLLDDISVNDLKSSNKTRFIYSGNGQFPYDAREQWTDSCNLLALKEGVVIGYDRNDKTAEAFEQNGFKIIHVADLLNKLERGEITPGEIKDTLILMPSAELSRARGGFHCMSMPLLRR